jgi:hypothetical protein
MKKWLFMNNGLNGNAQIPFNLQKKGGEECNMICTRHCELVCELAFEERNMIN